MLDKLLDWLARFVDQPDKVLHLAGGAIIAGVALALCLGPLAFPIVVSLVVAMWTGAIVAWLKEWHDKRDPLHHTWDGWDAFATFLGALVCVTLYAAARPVDQWGVC